MDQFGQMEKLEVHYYFNNSNSEVNCGNDSSLELSGEITLASWINPNSGADKF